MAPKKTSTKVSDIAPAPTVPAAPAPVAAPAAPVPAAPVGEVEKVKRPRKKSEPAAAAAAVEAEVPVSVVPPVSVPVLEEAPASEADILKADLAKHHQLVAQIVSLFAEVKILSKSVDKRVERVLKNANKKSVKRVRSTTEPRKPTGFCRPVAISDELAAFLGQAKGAIMPRTDASRLVYQIIQKNKEEPSVERTAQINALLNKTDEVPIKYCNLQTYLKSHFILLPESSEVVA